MRPLFCKFEVMCFNQSVYRTLLHMTVIFIFRFHLPGPVLERRSPANRDQDLEVSFWSSIQLNVPHFLSCDVGLVFSVIRDTLCYL